MARPTDGERDFRSEHDSTRPGSGVKGTSTAHDRLRNVYRNGAAHDDRDARDTDAFERLRRMRETNQ